ncbi:hypothetical protein EYB31_06360 [Paenibacillus thalictri]|uniref:Uncharacterized protein n=1 Tax=Paenibacillus thalictri TaxID=2527873 RepID=A0A4Q9DWQ4_9BACL|nr:hypothetical protein EYB31_06360 [Paenibacillus thalictri]
MPERSYSIQAPIGASTAEPYEVPALVHRPCSEPTCILSRPPLNEHGKSITTHRKVSISPEIKLFCSWNICDYRFLKTKQQAIQEWETSPWPKDKSLTRANVIKEWEKFYRRK